MSKKGNQVQLSQKDMVKYKPQQDDNKPLADMDA